jgi:hypothetical protein
MATACRHTRRARVSWCSAVTGTTSRTVSLPSRSCCTSYGPRQAVLDGEVVAIDADGATWCHKQATGCLALARLAETCRNRLILRMSQQPSSHGYSAR